MAYDSADLDWIDCNDLRRDAEAGGDGHSEQSSDGLSAGSSARQWQSRLMLIEPDGSKTEVPPLSLAPRKPSSAENAAASVADVKEKSEQETAQKAELKAKKKAEADAAKKAEAKAQAEAEAKAAREAKAKADAEAKEKAEADAKARKEAEAKARAEAKAAALAKQEAEEKAKEEADAKAAALARAKKEAEAKAKAEAEAKAKKEAEARAKAEAEAKAKAEREAKARAAAEAKAKKEAEEKAKAEAAAKARAAAKAKREAEAKAKKEAEAKAKREAEARAKAKAEAEAKAKAEAEAKAKKEAEAKAKREAEAKAKAEAAAKKKAEEEAKAKAAAEAKAKKEAEAKAKAEAEAKAAAEKAAAEAKAQAEREAAEKAAAEAKAKAEAEEKARLEAEEKAKAADLGKTFRRLIRETGPISLSQYMGESNARYYATRDPLGDDGDFITAPEISQMFGELIGLWMADLWVKMGSRKHIHYVELGPGRGTLAKDALRTAARYELDPQIHFVEGSSALREIQREAFPDVQHHHDLSTLPDDAPLLIVANEFFDALPIHQLVCAANGWHERMIGLDDDNLVFVAGDKPMDSIVPNSWRRAAQGTMIETSPAASAVMGEIATRLKDQGGAALVIDYGSTELRAGSTLQALKEHKKVDPLTHPGEADLTAHVDFELLQQVAKKNGADVMGLQMQGEWLRQMGIEVRHEALLRKTPNNADTLNRQYNRLVADDQMGMLFKVLGICGRRWPDGVGFD